MKYIQPEWTWYVAVLVEEATVEGHPDPVCLLESVLLNADSPAGAYLKASAICNGSEHVYRNSDGKVVTARYLGIHELDNLQVEALHDDLTLYVQRLDRLCGVGANALVHPREELTVFGGSSHRTSPNLDQ